MTSAVSRLPRRRSKTVYQGLQDSVHAERAGLEKVDDHTDKTEDACADQPTGYK